MSLVRSGRVIIYTNQVPYETDLLRTNMYRMADVSCLAQAVLGYGISNATLVSGLACVPTSPPSLAVNVGSGTIYSFVDYDASPYGVIPADTSDMLYKQGINLATTVISLSAPGSGTNFYLIQGQLNTNYNVNPVSRPYYNSANITQPIFTTQPDTVQDTVALQTKVSTVSTPTADSGWVPLWAVAVASGASTITSGDISVAASAPFISETLTQKISQAAGDARYVQQSALQAGSYIYGADSSGSANTVTVTLSPPLGSYTAGGTFRIKIANTNTGPTNININGLGAIAARKISSTGITAFVGQELQAGYIYEFSYDGTHLLLLGQIKPNIVAQMTFSTTQSITNSSADILMNFNTVNFDPFSITNNTSTHYSITVPVAGYYKVAAGYNAQNPNSNNSGSIYLHVYKNGSFLARFGQFPFASVDNSSIQGERIFSLAATDVIQCYAQNSGGAGAVIIGAGSSPSQDLSNCYFEIEYLGN